MLSLTSSLFFVHFVILKIMIKNEIRLGRVHGLFSGRAFLELPVMCPDVWTLYSQGKIRKSHVYLLCEVYVPLAAMLHTYPSCLDVLRRSVVSEASFFVRIRTELRHIVMSHFVQCFLRYDSRLKEYHIVLVFPSKVSEYV